MAKEQAPAVTQEQGVAQDHVVHTRLLAAIALLSASLGCAGNNGSSSSPQGNDSQWVAAEVAANARYAQTSIAVSGRIVDIAGTPIAQASIRAGQVQSSTDGDGRFVLPTLTRRNVLLEVTKPGYRVERVPVWLSQGLEVEKLALLPIILTPENMVRTLFGGDLQLGRAFLDPQGVTPLNEVPKDDPTALIRVRDPLPGTQRVFEWIRPQFSEADFAAANLETVVTDAPDTPESDRSFQFFTLPGSLPALNWAGLDYVSLANNHIYDYSDKGLLDTLRHLHDHGIPNSGAGATMDEAFRPHRRDVRGQLYSLLSLVSIEGLSTPNTTAVREGRAGAADLNASERIAAVLRTELAAGAIPIAMIHAGHEYTESPPEGGYTIGRLESVAKGGAKLVVAHHPHVAQGFSWQSGVLIAHSLGNLIFDQDRLETMRGLVLEVNWANTAIFSARGSGVYIDGYIPRPMAGFWQDSFLRRLAESSAAWAGAVVPYPGGAWIRPNHDAFVTQDRAIALSVEVDARGWAVVDLRPHLNWGESLYRISASKPRVSGRLGRDIFGYGDMEDMDVDGEDLEASRWWVAGLEQYASSFVCRQEPHRGSQALCLVRKSSNSGPSTMNTRNSMRVVNDRINLPQKDLTLLVYASANNAGAAEFEITYHASSGEKEFGSERPITLAPGTYDWKPVSADLNMPADNPQFPRDPTDPFAPELGRDNARALRIFGRHHPPAQGEGILRVDDVAVISWQDALELGSPVEVRVPHPRDFVRVESTPGTLQLSITVRRYLPRVAADP